MIFLHLSMACSPKFSRLSMANVEIMGVWLKAKTITGIEIHTVQRVTIQRHLPGQ